MSGLCPHFGICGGCQAQDVAYVEQIENKRAALADLLAPLGVETVTVEASPVLWHYRNKVDPTFGRKFYDVAPPEGFERESVLGFKRKGRWFWPIDIDTCLIGPQGLDALLPAVRTWMLDTGLPAFDTRNGQGFLRALLVRDAKRTGQRMVVLITTPGPFEPSGFVQAVRAVWPDAGIGRGMLEGMAELSVADELEWYHGPESIEERLEVPDPDGARSLSFRLSPFSFFQTNPLAAELLYGQLRAWVRETQPDTLYDLYGGMGSIAFSCSDLARRVVSVEGVFSATEDGQYNAAQNQITNVTFITENVKNYLLTELTSGVSFAGQTVILDPPRAGTHPKARRRLIELDPEHIFYVSCNPALLRQELPEFLDRYTVREAAAFDLFPHTRHVEVIIRLERRRGAP